MADAKDKTSVPPPHELKLSTAMRDLLEFSQASEKGITLEDVIERTGERAFTVLIAFLCLPFLIFAIPGTSVPFGAAIMILGVQLVLRWDRPWLPKFLLRRHLPKKSTEAVLKGVGKLFRPLEKWIKPRCLFMQSYWAYILVGITLIFDAFILSLPLPIPYTNTFPAWAILLKVLGNTEDDGVLLVVGLLLSAAIITVAVLTAGGTYELIMASYHAIMSWLSGH